MSGGTATVYNDTDYDITLHPTSEPSTDDNSIQIAAHSSASVIPPLLYTSPAGYTKAQAIVTLWRHAPDTLGNGAVLHDAKQVVARGMYHLSVVPPVTQDITTTGGISVTSSTLTSTDVQSTITYSPPMNHGTWLFPVLGVLAAAAVAVFITAAVRHHKQRQSSSSSLSSDQIGRAHV